MGSCFGECWRPSSSHSGDSRNLQQREVPNTAGEESRIILLRKANMRFRVDTVNFDDYYYNKHDELRRNSGWLRFPRVEGVKVSEGLAITPGHDVPSTSEARGDRSPNLSEECKKMLLEKHLNFALKAFNAWYAQIKKGLLDEIYDQMENENHIMDQINCKIQRDVCEIYINNNLIGGKKGLEININLDKSKINEKLLNKYKKPNESYSSEERIIEEIICKQIDNQIKNCIKNNMLYKIIEHTWNTMLKQDAEPKTNLEWTKQAIARYDMFETWIEEKVIAKESTRLFLNSVTDCLSRIVLEQKQVLSGPAPKSEGYVTDSEGYVTAPEG